MLRGWEADGRRAEEQGGHYGGLVTNLRRLGGTLRGAAAHRKSRRGPRCPQLPLAGPRCPTTRCIGPGQRSAPPIPASNPTPTPPPPPLSPSPSLPRFHNASTDVTARFSSFFRVSRSQTTTNNTSTSTLVVCSRLFHQQPPEGGQGQGRTSPRLHEEIKLFSHLMPNVLRPYSASIKRERTRPEVARPISVSRCACCPASRLLRILILRLYNRISISSEAGLIPIHPRHPPRHPPRLLKETP